MTTKTNEEWIDEFDELIETTRDLVSGGAVINSREWGTAIKDWLRTVLEAKDQQIAEAVEAERERFEMLISGGEVDVFASIEYKNGYIQCAKDIQQALTTPKD